MGQTLRIHHDQLCILGQTHAIELAIMQEELVTLHIFDVQECRELVEVRISGNEQLGSRVWSLVVNRDIDRVDEQDVGPMIGGKLQGNEVAPVKTLPLVHSTRRQRSLL
jgi:hypothetical protein